MIRGLLVIVVVVMSGFVENSDFLTEQKKYERVGVAYKEKGDIITAELAKEKIHKKDLNILLVAYKDEGILDLYAKNKEDHKYKRILSYAICAKSGHLGPKRKQGDNQMPEGFYTINTFNPASRYYLSLGINYPNKSDKIKSKAKDPGGDIFIHGECVTIGCLPMTNDKIKEIYLYAIQARQNGEENIPVYIFPFKMTNANMAKFVTKFSDDKPLLAFWSNLKQGHDMFVKDLSPLKITVGHDGNYLW